MKCNKPLLTHKIEGNTSAIKYSIEYIIGKNGHSDEDAKKQSAEICGRRTTDIFIPAHIAETKNNPILINNENPENYQHHCPCVYAEYKVRPRQSRTIFTSCQLHELQLAFDKSPYLSVAEKERLARRINVPGRTVDVWFQNKRAKWRRQSKLKSINRHCCISCRTTAQNTMTSSMAENGFFSSTPEHNTGPEFSTLFTGPMNINPHLQQHAFYLSSFLKPPQIFYK
nr:retinal homeobox protein Rx-A-like [Parasteatoda tepidariorum]